MTPLAERIARQIAAQGAITVADYMAQVLTDPKHGYYMTGDPFGRRGDFVTAPEISQMFGELIGLWCVDTWQRMGAPGRVLLVELGPGRGTLMADALRAAGLVPGFPAAAELHMVEVSPGLRARQREALRDYRAAWHDGVAGLPGGPLLLVANEFFDALPVRQFERTGQGWCERMVVLDDAGDLAFGLSPPSPAAAVLLPEALKSAPPGSLAEVSPAALGIATELGRRVGEQGGAALIIDYGRAESGLGASLQAVRRHQAHDVLAEPGSADLTAHVDFAALARAAGEAGARAQGPVAQGTFLQRLGLEARAKSLLREATPTQARDIAAAERRLADTDQMGSLFKALALAHPALGPLAGFA
ncbi:MAG: SAM-dependent methyltransferase [Rhodospirillales bacterium]|nr:SAM-dependent methyltransferase [Rhodospirillales bacterium]MDH3909704.1 SAM-dependent methyltransferase [Rhodospirillales bacterium]MDH3916662.1 SAM-dependent methyltransferase [Rhodospirillales bacterium]MDH3965819.1 SAM-dependent methyltransferase [Rhodospirillales bacterium]